MSETNLHYITDEKGNTTGVIVLIKLWQEIESERETAHLLRSKKMKKPLLDAKKSQRGVLI